MSHLHEFPPPSTSDATLCERNSKLIDNSATNVLDYRKISVKETLLHKKSLACTEMTPKEVFQSVEETVLDKLFTKWEIEGLAGVLGEIESMEQVPVHLRTVVTKLHALTDTLTQWKNLALPKKVVTYVPGKHQTMVCHPHTGRIAVIAKESTIKLLNLNRIGETDQEVILRDKRITEVTCLAWRPRAALSIAAGCRDGIMVWLLDPTTAATLKPGSHAARFLSSEIMPSAVSSISWCADGKLLACTCQNSSSFWVWNILSQQSTPLHRVGPPLSFVSWSPCNRRLLAATNAPTFRLWETMLWTSEKWADLEGKCTSAVWSSCGAFLLFSVSDEALIYYTHFYSDSVDNKINIGGSGTALKCADVSKVTFPGECSEEGIEVGGLICDMAWDPTDSRLAVTFYDGTSGNCQPYIALYHARKLPNLHLIPCGFIRGDEGQTPVNIDFVRGYDKGALLSVYWSDEEISLIPLLFNYNLASPFLQADEVCLDTTTVVSVDNIGEVPSMQNRTILYSASDE